MSRCESAGTRKKFPSPCGVLVLKWRKSPPRPDGFSSQFPSPCGVLVLKSVPLRDTYPLALGFRPLAGFWFLNRYVVPLVEDFMHIGFRPLAGFWFLNSRRSRVPSRLHRCFRPLAGFWFLNSTVLPMVWLSHAEFPSPCGVLVLKSATS